MLVHWILQLLVVWLALWLGGKLLKGVTFASFWVAMGAALYLGLISVLSEGGYSVILENFPPYTWTLFFLLWDAVWLLLLSRFISGLSFRKWPWAFALAALSALFQTIAWVFLPPPQ